MQDRTEVEITPRHRPTEYVRAYIWGFIFTMMVLIITLLVFERPNGIWDFINHALWDFAILVVLGIIGFFVGLLFRIQYIVNKPQIIDVGQFGAYIRKGEETVPLPPVYPENMRDIGQQVNLITPSEKSGTYLGYARAAHTLIQHGIDLETLQAQPEDEPLYIDPSIPDVGLTFTQRKVLDSYEAGHKGRTTVAKDINISEHSAQIALTELRAKGLIK
jgi:hypothetical protein